MSDAPTSDLDAPSAALAQQTGILNVHKAADLQRFAEAQDW
ncbi:hypothetical protein [Streptomyces sp. TLI_55]|nr:hypothetical protein [Streptomyces sp. TLI_55]